MSQSMRRFAGRLLLAGLFLASDLPAPWEPARANAPLTQGVYVWQRAWTGPVREAVSEHGAAFSEVVALAAEVSWNQKKPQIIRVPLDFGALTLTKRRIGLALRIGPFSGPFATNDSVAQTLCTLAASLVEQARTNQINPCELQLDFDCAESKLDGYRVWVDVIRERIASVPLAITALPSWLEQPAFARLIAATDGYVLQVHSLQKPVSPDAPFRLCDSSFALRAAVKASRFGVPFRVALPTYGYLIAFAANGRFIGLSAEGPAKSWPANARLREIRSDPIEMAMLARELAAKQLPGLRGLLWYRLPTIVDNLNWRWPTLGAIVGLRLPRESVRAQSRRVEAGLVEISLVNDGELDISSRLAVGIRWQEGRLVAADGLCGFELVEGDASTARFQTGTQAGRLFAGEQRTIGWLRFNKNVEVQLELKKQ